MAARLVRVAGDREAADDLAVVLGDEDGRVGMPPQRPQVAALVGDAAPAVRVQEPAPGSRPTAARELDERRRVLRPRRADRARVIRRRCRGRRGAGRRPPRACRPVGARPPRRRRSRGCGPPSARPSSPPGATLASSPPSRWSTSPSTWMRGASIASATGVPREDARRRPARSRRRAERSRRCRARGAGRPSSSTSVGVIMLGSRSPGAFGRLADRRRARRACCSAACRRGRCPSRSRASRRARPRCRRRR